MSVKVTSVDNLEQQHTRLYAKGQGVIKPGLERTQALLRRLGNPHQTYPSIHITGTNGKGSTAAMVESMLRAAGYRTGLYTSPHLHRVNERFQLNGQPIADAELAELIAKLDLLDQHHGIGATFHEFTTALAFEYFAEQQVEAAVIEVCMGGTWDATNVITPKVSVITNVALDHTKWLGPTKQHIAQAKAGIIKPQVPVVTAETDPVIQQYFANVARSQQAPLQTIDTTNRLTKHQETLAGQTFTYQDNVWQLPLLGEHQLRNAVTALVTLDVVATTWPTSLADRRTGLAATQWPGRLQVAQTDPLIIVDAAHNAASVAQLVDFLDHHAPERSVLVFGTKEDKDLTPWLQQVIPTFQHIILTEGQFMPRSAKELAQLVQTIHQSVQAIASPTEATQRALELTPPAGAIIIAGSLYMIPEALAYLATTSAH